MKKLLLIIYGLSYGFLAYSQEQNLIESVHCSKQSIRVVLNERLKMQKYVLEDFFVEYNDDEIDCTRLDYSIVTMPAIMNLITLIWASGDTYYIDAMDQDLFYSLQVVKEVFRRLYINTAWQGELKPRSLVNNASGYFVPQKSDDHIAVLFSQGLDSICTSFRHSDKKQLLLTVCGHSDCPLGYDEVWERLSSRITSFGKQFGHKNLFFRSNYHSFLDFKYLKKITPEIVSWRIEAIEGLGWIGLTAPILVSKGYRKLYIGSSYTWENSFPQAASPLVDNNIKFAGINIVHDAFDMPRVEKNRYLAQECRDRGIDSMSLRVCARILQTKERNCCDCEKCLRTITGFLVLGEEVKKYGFEISNYEAMDRVKKKLSSFKLVDRLAWCWREAQEAAKENYSYLGSRHKSFVRWFVEQDLDKITIFRPVEKIDWNNFTDLYDQIPYYLLKK